MMKTMAKDAGSAATVNSSAAGSATGSSPAILAGAASSAAGSAAGSQSNTAATPFGTTYITEKLYTVLQMYLQHKGWNSVELLQCFTEMKEAAMIPNAAAYLQMMASRVTLDTQARLVHRENGKLILPFEHFANAVMLKHINRPHTMHLNLEATVRAVMESYTIGRDYFGMEKEFIYEVVQNCPECRYYKSQMPSYHPLPETNDKSSKGLKDLMPNSQRQHQDYKSAARGQLPQSLTDANSLLRGGSGTPASFSKGSTGSDYSQSLELGSQSLGDLKTVNTMLELSRAKAAAAAAAAVATTHPSRSNTPAPTRAQLLNAAVAAQQQQLLAEKAVRNLQQEKQQQQLQHLQQQQQQQLQLQQQQQLHQQQIQLQLQQMQQQQIQQQQQQQQKLLQQHKLLDQFPTMVDPKLNDFMRSSLDNLDNFSSSNKDLLALHNGAWSSPDDQGSYKRTSSMEGGQEKIVRAFAEVMRNLHRMKMCIRPSMCKPYGKQSEMLQKTLEDTLLLVQAMRSFLPPPQF